MARPAVDAAQGMQLILVISNWTGGINSVSHGDVAYGEIDTTTLATTGGKTNILGDLYDPGMITVDYNWNSDNAPPLGTTQQIILMNPAYGTQTGTVVTLSTLNTFTTITSHPGFEVISGTVKTYNKKYPADPAKMEGTMTIRLSGSIARWTAGATVAS